MRLAALLSVWIMFCPIANPTAFSSIDTSSSAKMQLTPRILDLDGSPFIALPADQMGRVQLRLEAADKLEGVVQSQDELIKAQKAAIKTSTSAVGAWRDLAAEEKKRGDEFKAQAQSDEEKLNAWYRSPLLWTGIGAVGIVIIEVLVSGAHASSPTINVQR